MNKEINKASQESEDGKLRGEDFIKYIDQLDNEWRKARNIACFIVLFVWLCIVIYLGSCMVWGAWGR